MPEQLHGADVEVTLDDDGSFTLRWPATLVVLGPCRSAVELRDEVLAVGGAGRWVVRDGPADDRAGRWAHWHPSAKGASVALHVPTTGPAVVVEVETELVHDGTFDRVVALSGGTSLPYRRRLVDGYDSWAYSGIRGDDAGASFWNVAYVDEGGCALAIQALAATHLCTRITNDGPRLDVHCGATPPQEKVPGTWGYLTGTPPPLGTPRRSGEIVRSEPIVVGSSLDPLALVEELAGLTARSMHAREWTGAPPNGWESWYEYGLFVSADDVLANARALRTRYAQHPGFDLLQLDDGWQLTYGAWWPNERFPNDLADLVAELRSVGCRPGLWLAPFRIQPGAPGLATEHPDWCLRTADGAPLLDDRHGCWALDATNPAARAWLHDLGAQIRGWGFEMVKVDFCYLAALEGSRHDPRCSGIEALRLGMQALADGLGDEVYVLGCGMPMLPAVGTCHANRVGHDLAMPRAHQALGHPLDEGWTGFAGIRAQARNVAARWAQSARWYATDPEVVMAWGSDGTDPAGYSLDEARVLATMAMISGGPYLFADDLDHLAPAEHDVLEHPGLLSLVDAGPWRPLDLFAHADAATAPEHAYAQDSWIPRLWATRHRDAQLLACFNWDDGPLRLDLPSEFSAATEVWSGARVDGPQIEVPAHAVRLLRA